jgi:hypothetical protein
MVPAAVSSQYVPDPDPESESNIDPYQVHLVVTSTATISKSESLGRCGTARKRRAGVAEPPDTALVKFVRRVLRREPAASLAQVLEAWQRRRGEAVDEAQRAQLQTVYEEEAAALREGRTRTSEGGLVVGCGLVLVADVVILVLLGLVGGGLDGQVSKIATVLMVLIGLVQLLYVVPIGLRPGRRRNVRNAPRANHRGRDYILAQCGLLRARPVPRWGPLSVLTRAGTLASPIVQEAPLYDPQRSRLTNGSSGGTARRASATWSC